MHDSPVAGHMGISRTEDRIRQRFYWPDIRNSVEQFIHNCTACSQRKNLAQSNKAPLQHIEVGEPLHFGQWILWDPFLRLYTAIGIFWF